MMDPVLDQRVVTWLSRSVQKRITAWFIAEMIPALDQERVEEIARSSSPWSTAKNCPSAELLKVVEKIWRKAPLRASTVPWFVKSVVLISRPGESSATIRP